MERGVLELASGRGVGEGDDLLQHIFDVAEDHFVWEPDDSDTVLLQIFCAVFIVYLLFLLLMMSPIQFHSNFCFSTIEIENKSFPYRMLPAKFPIVELPIS
jgi:hypothetical protein